MNFNILVNKQNDDRVSKLNCKIEFFVPYNGHQNCLDKYLLVYQKPLKAQNSYLI